MWQYTSFSNSSSCELFAVLPDGSAVIGGSATNYSGFSYLARFIPGDVRFREFGAPNGPVSSLLATDDSLIVSGSFTDIGGVACGGLARYTYASQEWTPLRDWPNSRGVASKLAASQDSLYHLSRDIMRTTVEGGELERITFSNRTYPFHICAAPDGGVYASGYLREFSTFDYATLAHWSPVSREWTPLAWEVLPFGEYSGKFSRLVPGADGSVLAAAAPDPNEFRSALTNGQVEGSGLISLRPSDGTATVFGEGFARAPLTMTPLQDGTVFIGGRFHSVGNARSKFITR